MWESPKGSYCCSKSTDFEILGPLAKLRGVTKKSHGHNFDFSGLKRIGWVTNRVDHTCYSFQPRKIKIVAVTFFCDASFPSIFFSKFDLTLTANNSPLKSRTTKKYHIDLNDGSLPFHPRTNQLPVQGLAVAPGHLHCVHNILPLLVVGFAVTPQN